MNAIRTISVEKLLGEADWVRALAQRLVWGADDADDVAQEVLTRALERGQPAGEKPLRIWLAGLVQSAVHTRGRANRRRTRRERAHARDEGTATSTADLVQQAELQGELSRHVVALCEAQRVVVLLRFYEGLEPRHIAERLGLPVETVKTRLRRGLGQLRERLDEDHGSRDNWCAALAPLAGAWQTAGPALHTPTGGGAGVLAVLQGRSMVTLAFAVLAMAGIGAGLASLPERGPRSRAADLARRELLPVATGMSPAPESLIDRDLRDRTIPAGAAAVGASPHSGALAHAADRELSGRIVDVAGTPLVGLRVRWSDPRALRWVDETRTEIRGRGFWLRIDPARLRELRADSELRAAFARENFPEPDVAEAFLMDRASALEQGTTSRAGTFALRVPGEENGDDVELSDSRWMLIGEGTDVDDGMRTLVAARVRQVHGRCVHADGSGARSAQVRVALSMRGLRHMTREFHWRRARWEQSTDCSDDGSFTFTRVPDVENLVVFAHGGGENARATLARHDIAAVHLVLDDGPGHSVTLRGRVTSASGSPVSGAMVRCGLSSTRTDAGGRYELGPLWPTQGPFELVAAVQGRLPAVSMVAASGGAVIDVPPLVIGAAVRTISGTVTRADGTPVVGSSIRLMDSGPRVGGTGVERWGAIPGSSQLESDADGRFSIGGLAPRSYRIAIRADGATWSVALGAGQTELSVVLPTPSATASIQGVVRDRRQSPVAGAMISLIPARRELPDGLTLEPYVLTGPGLSAETDDRGRFALEYVPPGAALHVEGPGIVTRTVRIEGRGVLEITVPTTGRVRVDAASYPGALEICFLAPDGSAVECVARPVRGSAGFEVVRVSDAASGVVLYGMDHRELARLPVKVVPGKLVVVP